MAILALAASYSTAQLEAVSVWLSYSEIDAKTFCFFSIFSLSEILNFPVCIF